MDGIAKMRRIGESKRAHDEVEPRAGRRIGAEEMNFDVPRYDDTIDRGLQNVDLGTRTVNHEEEWVIEDEMGMSNATSLEKDHTPLSMQQGVNQSVAPPGLMLPNSKTIAPAHSSPSILEGGESANPDAGNLDFYDYMNAHTAIRPSVEVGILKTPTPVKSVINSVADALEMDARSKTPTGEYGRPYVARASSFESFRGGSQDPEVPISRGNRISVAPISPPPKMTKQSGLSSVPEYHNHSHSHHKRASQSHHPLPPLQIAAPRNNESADLAPMLSPLSPFHMKSPFPDMYPPILSLQSPEVRAAPAPMNSPMVPTLHPILVPVRQEDGSDIWMQSTTPLSPSKQDAIYQESLGSYHQQINNHYDTPERWDTDHIHHRNGDHQLFSPTSTTAASDFFGMNPLSPRQAPSPQTFLMSPSSFGHMDPISPSAMYPSFNPFDVRPGGMAGYTAGYDSRADNGNRSSSGSGHGSGSGSISGPSPELPNFTQHHHQSRGSNGTTSTMDAETDMYWEKRFAEVDPKRSSGSSAGSTSYYPHEKSSPNLQFTAVVENGMANGFSKLDVRDSPTHRAQMRASPLRVNSSQSPSPTRVPQNQTKSRPVIDTSVALKLGYSNLAPPAHRRTTSLTPTSILSGDNIWGAPGDVVSPTATRHSIHFGVDERYQAGYGNAFRNGGPGWTEEGSRVGLEGLRSPVAARTPSGGGRNSGDYALPHTIPDLYREGVNAVMGNGENGVTGRGYRMEEEGPLGSHNGIVTTTPVSYSDVLKQNAAMMNGNGNGYGAAQRSDAFGGSMKGIPVQMMDTEHTKGHLMMETMTGHAGVHERSYHLDREVDREKDEMNSAYMLLPQSLLLGTPEPVGDESGRREVSGMVTAAAEYFVEENGHTTSNPEVNVGDHEAPPIPVAEELLKSKLRSDPARLTRAYFDALSRAVLDVVNRVRMGGASGARWEQDRERLSGVATTVRTVLESVFPGASVHQVGSTVSGLALTDADMDFTVLFPRGVAFSAVQCVEKLGAALRHDGPFADVKPLPRAKVPIVKLRDVATGIRCDVSFGHELALYNTRLLGTYALIDERVRWMVVFLKYWVRRRGINFPVMGHPSSYCYTLLVINFLQRRGVIPSLQHLPPPGSADVPPPERYVTTITGTYNVYFFDKPDRLSEVWQTDNQESVGELLLAFFKDFGTELDFVYKVSSVRVGGLLHKTEKNWSKDSVIGRSGGGRIRHWMAVEDPFDTEQNLSSSVDRDLLHAIRGHFQVVSKVLCGATDLPTPKGPNGEALSNAALARLVVDKICEECEPLRRSGGGGGGGRGGGGGGSGAFVGNGRRGRRI
ncbi:hypothetical protein HDV00_005670 [Rhizophlyctis rosea]|nr:hypothetical protein HDV00_005670 [Rhizophlyctis rosea]